MDKCEYSGFRLPKEKQMIKDRYTASEVRERQCLGEAYISAHNTHLRNAYTRDGVSIEELAIIDKENRSTWFASKLFHGIDPIIKPRIYDAMEMMRKRTKGKMFGSSPDAEPLSISALSIGGKKLSKKVIDYFKELEAVVIVQEGLLRKK